MTFASAVLPTAVSVTFQGGFVGIRCCVYYLPPTVSDERPSSSDWLLMNSIFPEDVNRSQTFALTSTTAESGPIRTTHLKLVFEESSDFFGRVTIYDLDVSGYR